MTTSVTIKAHCDKNTVVRVAVRNGAEPLEEFLLRDGETAERLIYGDRSVSVQEHPLAVKKEIP